MSLTGKGLAEYAISKLGTPYFYGSKMTVLTEAFMAQMARSYPGTVTPSYIQKARAKCMVGKICCDCSGLIGAYRGKQIGSSQLYSTAHKRLPISHLDEFAVGTVLWKSGHVGVYIGGGYCVEEKGINYGCVKTKVSSTPWKYGLTFSDMSYDYDVHVTGTSKTVNPYQEPTKIVTSKAQAKACGVSSYIYQGEGVKWIQWELCEAGYKKEISKAGGIDGICGKTTVQYILDFQRSAKIEADGLAGSDTRKHLKMV